MSSQANTHPDPATPAAALPSDRVLQKGIALKLTRSSLQGVSLVAFRMEVGLIRGSGAGPAAGVGAGAGAEAGQPGA